MTSTLRTHALCTAFVLLAFQAFTPAAAAQSIFNAAGLGYPIAGVDARAVVLGGTGVGLFGDALVPAYPAGAADFRLPTFTASLQSTWGTPEQGGLEGEVQGNRFPMLGIAYPVGDVGVATLTFEGVLDQRWRVSRVGSVQLSGEDVDILDRFTSDGGISAARLGWGQRLGADLAVGATVGYHIGDVRRSFTRSFDTLAVGSQVSAFTQTGRWGYSGPTASVGFLWDVVEIVRVGGNLVWSGTLEGEAEGGDAVEGREIDLPLRLQAGASAVLAPDLSLSAGLSYADWSDTGMGLASGVAAGTVWSMGAGIEWEGPRLRGRDFPIRLGYRRADLPFSLEGSDATESVVSAGLGITLAQTEEFPLARIEAALERGTREDDILSETFWRASLSLRVSGR